MADQYLDFIAARRRLDLEIAADYLVMAAILAYLKSCLLLPPAPRDDEPTPRELALGLRHRLALLEAMQRAGRRLMARPLLGREVFARGAPEELAIVAVPRWQIGLYEFLRAYGDVHRRQGARVLPIEPSAFQSVQEAFARLARLLGRAVNWRELSSFLPPAPAGDEARRSHLAASFAAALELARLGPGRAAPATGVRPDLAAPRRVRCGGAAVSDRVRQLRLVEALLFAAAEPLTEEALRARLGPEADLPELLRALAANFEGRGVDLVRLAGGWAFRTAPDLAEALRVERPVSRKLSRAAVETLAVVAYHQPVTRAEIEEIRGVGLAKGTLDTLIEAGWVRPRGRRISPGRPLLWVTTPGFLAHFGLDSLADLPAADELRAAGLLDLAPPAPNGEERAAPEPD